MNIPKREPGGALSEIPVPSSRALPIALSAGPREALPPTVADVIEGSVLRGTRVLAGSAGLDRDVTGANIAEVPEVTRWLRGGELLFTSGYPWRDDPGQLTGVVAELHRLGVRGMGVKLSRHLRALPDATLALADDVGFPIIEVPGDVAYMDVIVPLLHRLGSYRLWIFEQVAGLQSHLAELECSRAGLEQLCEVIARHVDATIYAIDELDEVVIEAEPGQPPRRLDPTSCRHDAELVDELAHVSLARGADAQLASGDRFVGAALPTGLGVRGRVVAVGGDPSLGAAAVAAGASTMATLLASRAAAVGAQRRTAALFLKSLLSDDLDAAEVEERAEAIGVRLDRPTAVLLVVGAPPRAMRLDDLCAVVERTLKRSTHLSVAGRDELTVVLHGAAARELEPRDQADAIVARATEAGLRAVVAFGGSGTGVAGLRRSHAEARVALSAARRQRRSVVGFADLGADRILAQIPDSPVVRQVIDAVLGSIADDDELVRTLEVFFEHGGRKVQTASAIPVHRSTLDYRLEKISKLLDADLDDPETRLDLHLALRLRHLLVSGVKSAPAMRR